MTPKSPSSPGVTAPDNTHRPRQAGELQRNSTRTAGLGERGDSPRGLPTHTFAEDKVKARIQSKS